MENKTIRIGKYCKENCNCKFCLQVGQFKKGHIVSKEIREKLKEIHKGKHYSPETEFKRGMSSTNGSFKKGNIVWNKGLTKENDDRIRIMTEKSSLANKGKRRSPKTEFKKGNKHSNWQNGKSFEPYGIGFNEKLKEDIRRKYFYRCQQCFRHQNELRRKLDIHHIDFNKNNNKEKNLIPLCNGCHSQTNFNREDWTEYFQDKLGS